MYTSRVLGVCFCFFFVLFYFVLPADISMKLSDSLELELQAVVNCHVGAGN